MFATFASSARLRSLALIVIGSCIGAALVGPVSAGGPAPQGTIQTRAVSCPGLEFEPITDSTSFASFVSLRIGQGYFVCDPGLPHRAVVTKVQFTLRDAASYGEATNCALVRHSLAPASAGIFEVMALIPGTGEAATPGTVRRSTSAITHATVLNHAYVYFLQCQLTDVTTEIGIHGASVTFTISSANG